LRSRGQYHHGPRARKYRATDGNNDSLASIASFTRQRRKTVLTPAFAYGTTTRPESLPQITTASPRIPVRRGRKLEGALVLVQLLLHPDPHSRRPLLPAEQLPVKPRHQAVVEQGGEPRGGRLLVLGDEGAAAVAATFAIAVALALKPAPPPSSSPTAAAVAAGAPAAAAGAAVDVSVPASSAAAGESLAEGAPKPGGRSAPPAAAADAAAAAGGGEAPATSR